jgi:hypothetical protein
MRILLEHLRRARFSRSRLGLLLVTLTVGALAPASAEAYPQWQFSSDTARCSQCHFSPAGGGIVTGYARDAVGDELSTWQGDGSFLHGLIELPAKLAVQFDGRYASVGYDYGNPSGMKQAFFPMQADLAIRGALTDALSVAAVVGYRGQVRASDAELGRGGVEPAGGSLFISREHYLMYRPQVMGWYVRAGRFFAPFGLRLAEHYAYVRRDTGFNLLEESYNLSGGVVKNEWELHVTAFAPDYVRKLGGRDTGLAGLFERRLGEASALGASLRLALKDAANSATGGLFGKTYLAGPRILVQAEANVATTTVSGGASSNTFTGYLGLTWFPIKSLWVTPFGERLQTDLSVNESATNAGGLQLSWFPYPHFELVWMLRAQMPSGQKTGTSGMLFAHYYL